MNLDFQLSSKKVSSSIQIGPMDLEDFVTKLAPLGSKFALLTQESLSNFHKNWIEALRRKMPLELITFEGGEKNKTRETKAALEDQLIEKKFGSDSCLMALGGGVVTDVGGYLAATYCRGINYVTVPTTLLGMVDASIGGKNGVNVGTHKNFLGTLYFPTYTFMDCQFLTTLPPKELFNGRVEMLKHGVIRSQKHFEDLQSQSEITDQLIYDSCFIKKSVVEENETFKGLRDILNMGHTVGHALESHFDYSLSHGEAVAVGIKVECHMAWQLGHLSESSFNKVLKAFDSFKLPSQVEIHSLIDKMNSDKKSLKREPHFVLLKEIGIPLEIKGKYSHPVPSEILINSLNWMNHALCSH